VRTPVFFVLAAGLALVVITEHYRGQFLHWVLRLSRQRSTRFLVKISTQILPRKAQDMGMLNQWCILCCHIFVHLKKFSSFICFAATCFTREVASGT